MQRNPQDYARWQRFSKGPDWRRQLAEAWLADPQHDDVPADPDVQVWCAYLRRERGEPHNQDLAAAECAHLAAVTALTEKPAITDELRILVVAGCTPEDISRRLSVDAKVLAVWETIFFDVRPVRTAMDWIVHKVIKPIEDQGNAALAVKLKLAMAAGPLAAQAALEAESSVLARQGCNLFDLKVCLHMKFQQAVELGLDSAEQQRLYIKTHTDLLYREKKLLLEERKLAQKCQEALHKHELAMGQLELRRQRAAERTSTIAPETATKNAQPEVARGRKRHPQAAVPAPSEPSFSSKRKPLRRASVGQPLEHVEGCSDIHRPEPSAGGDPNVVSAPTPGSRNCEPGPEQALPVMHERAVDLTAPCIVEVAAQPTDAAWCTSALVAPLVTAGTLGSVATTFAGCMDTKMLPCPDSLTSVLDPARRSAPVVVSLTSWPDMIVWAAKVAIQGAGVPGTCRRRTRRSRRSRPVARRGPQVKRRIRPRQGYAVGRGMRKCQQMSGSTSSFTAIKGRAQSRPSRSSVTTPRMMPNNISHPPPELFGAAIDADEEKRTT
jgi:hypothetical protein